MPTWLWIVIVAVAAIVVLAIVWAALRKRRTRSLKERFGPEYDRVAADAPTRRDAESELRERAERRDELEIRPLDPRVADRYRSQWTDVQARFVDDPPGAVQEADTLIQSVMRDRGYPVAVRPAGGGPLRRPPAGRRELPRSARHRRRPRAGQRRHRRATEGGPALPRAVRGPAGDARDRGGDEMTDERLTTADIATSEDAQAPMSRDADGDDRGDDGDRQQALEPLLEEKRAQGLRDRWHTLQARFVDDPRETVADADALVAELLQELASTFSSARADLERQWTAGDDVSTEDLRLALQRYRSFFERLLNV